MWALKALSGAGQLSGRYQAPFNVGSVIFSANHGYTFAAYGGTPDGGTYTVKGDTLTLDPTSGQAATAGEANDPLYQAMAASLTTTLSADHNSFALGGVTYIKQ